LNLKSNYTKSVRLRDTFAGKMRLRFERPCPSFEKVVRFLPAKVSRRCPYQVIILGTQLKVYIRTCVRIKIATWYGHLRDTFAGKNLTTFSKLGQGRSKLNLILPAKVSRNLTDFFAFYY
jgi:hypothetical protein